MDYFELAERVLQRDEIAGLSFRPDWQYSDHDAAPDYGQVNCEAALTDAGYQLPDSTMAYAGSGQDAGSALRSLAENVQRHSGAQLLYGGGPPVSPYNALVESKFGEGVMKCLLNAASVSISPGDGAGEWETSVRLFGAGEAVKATGNDLRESLEKAAKAVEGLAAEGAGYYEGTPTDGTMLGLL